MNRYTVNGYTRVSKARARKIWNAGGVVYACACNIRPGGPWYCEAILRKSDNAHPSFDADANAVTWYNCLNSETGRYLAYYVREGAGPQ